MTDAEIKKLAKEIVAQKGGFYVEPETHYQQHERLDRLLDIYDSTTSIFMKVFIGAMCVGAFALVFIGFGWHK